MGSVYRPEQMIWRFDDVSPSLDWLRLRDLVTVIRTAFPGTAFWFGVSIISATSEDGAVYRDPPFKDRPLQWFYAVDKIGIPDIRRLHPDSDWVLGSHGLLHVDHSKLTLQAQEMSILTSCNLLNAKVFLPPFNRFNEDTERICQENGIFLVKQQEHGWKSLEFNDYDPSHKRWYLHPWRWTTKTLLAALEGDKNTS